MIALSKGNDNLTETRTMSECSGDPPDGEYRGIAGLLLGCQRRNEKKRYWADEGFSQDGAGSRDRDIENQPSF